MKVMTATLKDLELREGFKVLPDGSIETLCIKGVRYWGSNNGCVYNSFGYSAFEVEEEPEGLFNIN